MKAKGSLSGRWHVHTSMYMTKKFPRFSSFLLVNQKQLQSERKVGICFRNPPYSRKRRIRSDIFVMKLTEVILTVSAPPVRTFNHRSAAWTSAPAHCPTYLGRLLLVILYTLHELLDTFSNFKLTTMSSTHFPRRPLT
jgi:hypothetical protein